MRTQTRRRPRADGRQRPGLDHRPGRRHDQLRQRHPVLLRVDRPRRSTAGRRSASSSTRRATSCSRRRSTGRRRSTASRSRPPTRTSCRTSSSRWRCRAGRSSRGRGRSARQIRISRSMGSSALALAYVANGRFDAFIQQGGMSNWDVAAAGLIAERAGATRDRDGRRAVVRPSGASRGRSASVAAPAAHHADAAGPDALRCSSRGLLRRASGAAGREGDRGPRSSQNASHGRRGAPCHSRSAARRLRDRDAVLGRPEPGERSGRACASSMWSRERRREHRRAAEARDLPLARLRRDPVDRAVDARGRPPPTSRPSRAGPDSRRRSRRRARASPGSRPARRPTSRGRRHRRRRGSRRRSQQHDPVVLDELGHVLVGRADQDPLDRSDRRRSSPAAAAIASSASNSTIGQSAIPSASIACSAIGNWSSSSRGMPAHDL